MRLMQRQPFVRLLDRVVMELVVHPPGPQGLEQITSHVFGKLALMDDNLSGRRHATVVADSAN